MNERQFEDIIEKHPDLIEEGLTLIGRQVRVKGKIIDLLFEDRYRQKLIVELKIGPVKRDHIGQIMDYEGHLLFPDEPTVRIMLVGNRVPKNFQRSLDHHGIEWREFTHRQLEQHLREKGDTAFLSYLSIAETHNTHRKTKKKEKPKKAAPVTKLVIKDYEIENEEKALRLFNKIQDEKVLDILKDLMDLLGKKVTVSRAVSGEFKFWLQKDRRCSLYIRPFMQRIDIYLELFSPSDIEKKNKSLKIPLVIKENSSNPNDQFKSVIIVSGEWLSEHKNRINDLLKFFKMLIDDLSDLP